ncbi:MAG: hypothetical protein ACFB4J_18475 [Elainellaceae cyanobacterium]
MSLTAVLVVALPVVVELGRAARSAEKLFDTLNRELPPVLNAMQMTGQELGELTEEVSESVGKAGRLVRQVDQGVQLVKQQAGQVGRTGRSVMAGARAAWVVLRRQPRSSAPAAPRPDFSAPDFSESDFSAPAAPPQAHVPGEAPSHSDRLQVRSSPLSHPSTNSPAAEIVAKDAPLGTAESTDA